MEALFDPSSVLKAFCWAYSRVHHAILCLILGVCYFRKSYSTNLEDFQISEFMSTCQIQESFLSYLKKDPIYDNLVTLPTEEIKYLLDSFYNSWETYVKPTFQSYDYLNWIKKFFLKISHSL